MLKIVKNEFNVKPDAFRTGFTEMTYYFIPYPLPAWLEPAGGQNLPDQAIRGDAQLRYGTQAESNSKRLNGYF
jgi:hypothetical protein